jgi:hypothetical protein
VELRMKFARYSQTFAKGKVRANNLTTVKRDAAAEVSCECMLDRTDLGGLFVPVTTNLYPEQWLNFLKAANPGYSPPGHPDLDQQPGQRLPIGR